MNENYSNSHHDQHPDEEEETAYCKHRQWELVWVFKISITLESIVCIFLVKIHCTQLQMKTGEGIECLGLP